MKKILSFVITLLFSMTLLTPVMAEITVPPKPKDNSYVHDLANMLTTEHTRKMMAIGSSIEKASGAEIVVVTVETLGENTIEEYANILFRSWGIGDKEKNNGVLLLVNKENVLAGESGRVRIEVGYGLEGAIPDGKAGRILDEYVLPPWTELDYSTGIYQGFMSIAKAVVDEYNLELDQEQALRELDNYSMGESSDDGFSFAAIIFIIIIIVVILLNNRGGGGRGRRNRTFGTPFPSGSLFGGPFQRGGFGGGSSGGGGASR